MRQRQHRKKEKQQHQPGPVGKQLNSQKTQRGVTAWLPTRRPHSVLSRCTLDDHPAACSSLAFAGMAAGCWTRLGEGLSRRCPFSSQDSSGMLER